MKIFVIIPAFNEENRIGKVIRETRKYARNVVVVDDGSTDNTYSEAAKTGSDVLKHVINLGKGAALRTGTEYAIRKGADSVVYIDSDGQHSPKDIPELLKNIPDSDIVFAYRDLESKRMPIIKKLGNFALDRILRVCFGVKIMDTQCGFKAMTKKAYRKLGLISSSYTIESELRRKTGKYNLRFSQVPIETVYQNKYKGTHVFDGISIALNMLWWKFSG